jgi:hypothetical protein
MRLIRRRISSKILISVCITLLFIYCLIPNPPSEREVLDLGMLLYTN